MRPEPVTITLADKSYSIRPLTLRQTRDIEVATSKTDYPSHTDQLCAILDAVLRRDHEAALPEGGVLDMEVTMPELHEAASQIKKLAGMQVVPAGEAKAAPPAARSSGTESTGG